MECINSESLLHRSKHRIKKLGEVFTPEKFVTEMLSLVSSDQKDVWCDEEIVFFEPCCGHGNIVVQVLSKRMSSIYSQAVKNKINNPANYAVANAINTLWAIDIDEKNIKECRSRVFTLVMAFLKEKNNLLNYKSVILFNREFIAHLICAIKWQIQVNETLSAISDQSVASENAHRTLEGGKWYIKNDYHPLNLKSSWMLYFMQCLSKQSTPVDFKRAMVCIKKISCNRFITDSCFDFINEI